MSPSRRGTPSAIAFVVALFVAGAGESGAEQFIGTLEPHLIPDNAGTPAACTYGAIHRQESSFRKAPTRTH